LQKYSASCKYSVYLDRLKESLNQAFAKLAEQDLLDIPDKLPSVNYSRIADIDMATPAGKALQLMDKILSGEKVSLVYWYWRKEG
jgi:hypothetical protein